MPTKAELMETCKDAVNRWGEDAQIDMMIEECSELIKALLKFRRDNNRTTHANIKEEMADVYIMLCQMEYCMGDYSKEVDLKLERLKARLSEPYKPSEYEENNGL